MVATGSRRYEASLGAAWRFTALAYPLHLRTAGVDDMLWWAAAWRRAAVVTGDSSYLARSRAYFAQAVGFWDDACGGGVWWNRAKTYKNAISNELFLLVAMQLHQATGEQEFLDWGARSWRWFNQSGLINSQGLVNDGLVGCQNNGQETWTYNQGVLLGGLALLYQHSQDQGMLARACEVADAAIERLSYRGVLQEPCEPGCNTDQQQFKGIFMRYLARLTLVLPSSHAAQQTRYTRFITTNTEAIQTQDPDGRRLIPLEWGKPGAASGITHTSGLECWNARLLVESAAGASHFV